MTVSSLPLGVLSGSFAEFRSFGAAALAARCGDDVVRLRPMWPAIIAATRFARRAHWAFGNRLARLECIEPQRKRWLGQRDAGDPMQLQFALDRWSSAYARTHAGGREIVVFAADGTMIAAVRLDDVDAALDELLWLLVDADQSAGAAYARRGPAPQRAAGGAEERLRATLPLLEHRADFDRIVARSGITRQHAFHLAGPAVAHPLWPGALNAALRAAWDAELPLQLAIQNSGGRVAWTPQLPLVHERPGALEIRSALGWLTVRDRSAGVWAVDLARTASADQTLEAYGGSDAEWLTVALDGPTEAQRHVWRRLCASLVRR